MSEIKIGDQVKTNRGYIGKVVGIKEFGLVIDIGCGFLIHISKNQVKKVGEKDER